MGIMTVGLLGVASVFPVGSWYMQKAEVADNSSALAQEAMNSVVTSGMLNPHAWFVMTPPTTGPAVNTIGSPGFIFRNADGKYVPRNPPNAPPSCGGV